MLEAMHDVTGFLSRTDYSTGRSPEAPIGPRALAECVVHWYDSDLDKTWRISNYGLWAYFRKITSYTRDPVL